MGVLVAIQTPSPVANPVGAGSVRAVATVTGAGKAVKSGSGTITAIGSMAASAESTPAGSGSIASIASMAGNGFSESLASGQRRLVYYIDEGFQSGLASGTFAELKARLVKYTDDMNTILAKTTSLQFVYDPDEDCILKPNSDFPPGQISANTAVPTPHHFAAWIAKASSGDSTGGTSWRVSTDEVGATFLEYAAIWAESDITGDTEIPGSDKGAEMDYVFQLNTILHELGHAHGLGISEYYNILSMTDNSGVSPTLNTLDGSGGNYFDTRGLVLLDPMVGFGIGTASLADYLEDIQFCPLSAAIIDAYALETLDSGDFYYGASETVKVPDQFTTPFPLVVEVLDANSGLPIQGADVAIYHMEDIPSTSSLETADSTEETDVSGLATFVWGGDETISTQGNKARLLKASATGYTNNGTWLTCFDLQAWKIEQEGFYTQDTANDFHYPNKVTIELTPT